MERNIFFWFDSPPKVGKGAFNYVANNYSGTVHYVFNNDFREERKATKWDDGDYGKAHLHLLYKEKNEEDAIAEIFREHSTDIHLINGFSSLITKKIKSFIIGGNVEIGFLSERPVLMGNWLEHHIRAIYFSWKYASIRRTFFHSTKVVLPLGMLGVRTFNKYGWPMDRMFPFMYNPVLKCITPKYYTSHHPLRFLYVGRFYYKTKGVDTLMKATNYLHGEWELHMVGGYGKNANEVITWAESHPHVQYLGSWSSPSIVSHLIDYDVVVIPSKYDGWNLLVNEALHAGIGAIATDQTTSHEVIENSEAGMVVKANNPKALSSAMQYAIDNPKSVIEWKQRATRFCPNISTEKVGQYLLDIINFSFNKNIGSRPICPWIKKQY